MKVGYIRVSSVDQNLGRQEELMKKYEIGKVFSDKFSGKSLDRPGLNRMISFVREGDTVIVESISRFARNTKDLLDLVDRLDKKKVAFRSLKEQIDTTTPSGRFVLTIFGALAQLEREYIHDRQMEGIVLAQQQGKYKGRKPVEVDEKLFAAEYRAWKQGTTAPRFIMSRLNLKPSTFYRRVHEYEDRVGISNEKPESQKQREPISQLPSFN